jgi:hypothetical protein
MINKGVYILLLITLMVLGIGCVQPVTAQYKGNIAINADGGIIPATAPIQKTDTSYCLIGDIVGSIKVNANNIVLDGRGALYQASHYMRQRT